MNSPSETLDPLEPRALVKEENDEDVQATENSDSNPRGKFEVITVPPQSTLVRRDGDPRNLARSTSSISGRGPAILMRPNLTAVRSANPNFIRMNLGPPNQRNQIAFIRGIRGSQKRFAAPVGPPQQTPGGRMCVVMRQHTKSVSTMTDVSNKEFNALDRKSNEYDLLKDAYENKLRQGRECTQKNVDLKDQCQKLTEENTKLKKEVEELKSNEKNYGLQIQVLSNRAQEMEETLDSANMRHEKEYQEINTHLKNANELIEVLLHGMNAQFKKGSVAYAKLKTSMDDVAVAATIVDEADGDEEMELDVGGSEDIISLEKDEEVEEDEEGVADDLSERGSIVNEETARRVSTRLSTKPSSSESTNNAVFSHGPGEVKNQCRCGKLFSSKYTLKKHCVRFNARRKDFCCQLCPVKFTHGYMLHEHVKLVHPGSKKNFVCRFCGAFLKSRKMLSKHQNTVHGGGKRSYRKRVSAKSNGRIENEECVDSNNFSDQPDQHEASSEN